MGPGVDRGGDRAEVSCIPPTGSQGPRRGWVEGGEAGTSSNGGLDNSL